MGFLGEFNTTIDPKGRITLPARCREALEAGGGQRVVLVADLREACLLLYSVAAFDEVQAQFMAIPNSDDRVRGLQRLLFGSAFELEIDATGRVVVPPKLRKHAGLEGRLAVVGQGQKYEIWKGDVWDERDAEIRRRAAADLDALNRDNPAFNVRI